MVSSAEEGITSDGFEWSYEDGIMAITGYEGNAARIDIPSKINGISMTKICDFAFNGCNSCKASRSQIRSPILVTGLSENAII